MWNLRTSVWHFHGWHVPAKAIAIVPFIHSAKDGGVHFAGEFTLCEDRVYVDLLQIA